MLAVGTLVMKIRDKIMSNCGAIFAVIEASSVVSQATEGFYNKMGVNSRRDFGCRNFKNIVEECLP